ncbi:ribosomal rna large subunit methyltransferase j protein [Cystoisospora suis]|uniref:Cap-specific mRNA (nucleoside-2'-O-)-methyltransferase 1 n=1 Tax=Cystoisospora suis TaxID=483139 RepID=A0A2C6L5G5_9APIC|nr:ribosomal rna large subunit methyltransferase j protein [Cystoisospora suis]
MDFSPAYGRSPVQGEILQTLRGATTPRTPGLGGSPTARSAFLYYPLKCSLRETPSAIESLVSAVNAEPLQMRSARDSERLLHSDFCERALIEEQLRQKSLLDEVYDAGQGKIWKVAQFSMFPSDCKGSFQHRTRSGDKLQEISEWLQERRMESLPEMLVKGASPTNPSFFLDLCAGPGTWSDWLLDEIDCLDQKRFEAECASSPGFGLDYNRGGQTATPGHSCYGFGISLTVSDLVMMKDSKFWHIAREVTERPNYEGVTGLNRSGNLYSSKNIRMMRQKIEQRVNEIVEFCASRAGETPSAGQGISPLSASSRLQRGKQNLENKGVIKLIVADGGITVPKVSVTGQHLENYQELLTGRLLLSEFALSFQLLQHGGTFVCSVFDVFTPFTASLLYMCTVLFEEVYIVKPSRNRWTNSERQLVALNFRRLRSINLSALVAASAEAAETTGSVPSTPSRSTPSRRAPYLALVSRVYTAFRDRLLQVHEAIDEATAPMDYYTILPETVLPRSVLTADTVFAQSYRHMCEELCRLQCTSLNQTYMKFLELQRDPEQLSELRQRQRTLERCMSAVKGGAAAAVSSSLRRPASRPALPPPAQVKLPAREAPPPRTGGWAAAIERRSAPDATTASTSEGTPEALDWRSGQRSTDVKTGAGVNVREKEGAASERSSTKAERAVSGAGLFPEAKASLPGGKLRTMETARQPFALQTASAGKNMDRPEQKTHPGPDDRWRAMIMRSGRDPITHRPTGSGAQSTKEVDTASSSAPTMDGERRGVDTVQTEGQQTNPPVHTGNGTTTESKDEEKNEETGGPPLGTPAGGSGSIDADVLYMIQSPEEEEAEEEDESQTTPESVLLPPHQQGEQTPASEAHGKGMSFQVLPTKSEEERLPRRGEDGADEAAAYTAASLVESVLGSDEERDDKEVGELVSPVVSPKTALDTSEEAENLYRPAVPPENAEESREEPADFFPSSEKRLDTSFEETEVIDNTPILGYGSGRLSVVSEVHQGLETRGPEETIKLTSPDRHDQAPSLQLPKGATGAERLAAVIKGQKKMTCNIFLQEHLHEGQKLTLIDAPTDTTPDPDIADDGLGKTKFLRVSEEEFCTASTSVTEMMDLTAAHCLEGTPPGTYEVA